jgi:hypothetical protein
MILTQWRGISDRSPLCGERLLIFYFNNTNHLDAASFVFLK